MPLPKFLQWLTGRTTPSKPTPPPLPSFALESEPPKHKADAASAARDAILAGKAPDDFAVRRLDLSECTDPFRLPARLNCFELNLSRSSIETLPAEIAVAHRIDLTGCGRLTSLPRGLWVGTLVLRDCTALEALPEDLDVHFLVLDGCRGLQHWPESAKVHLGHVSARGCAWLTQVPASLGPISSLDLSGCGRVATLPEGVRVTSWIDLQGTAVRALPESSRGVRLKRDGALVSAE